METKHIMNLTMAYACIVIHIYQATFALSSSLHRSHVSASNLIKATDQRELREIKRNQHKKQMPTKVMKDKNGKH